MPTAEAAFPGRNGLIAFDVEQTAIGLLGGGLNGDIFVVRADGVGVHGITEGPADDHHPAWSPDGRRLAFTRGVGNRLADIYVMTSNGGDIVNLTPGTPEFADSNPAWSPDGSRIVFTRKPLDGVYQPVPGTPINGDLYVMDADGSDLSRVTEGQSEEGSPAWSPDGNWIAYSDGSYINLIHPDGSGLFGIGPFEASPAHLSWSPNGRRIAFTIGGNISTGEEPIGDIWVVDRNGHNLQNLTLNATGREAVDSNGSWSPDGQQIVFVSNREGPYYLFKMNADGSQVERMLDIELSGTSTSPDWGPR